MSFRTVRNIGLGIMLLIVLLVSFLSYQFMSRSAQTLEITITIEETKLKRWYLLLEIIATAKDSLFDYYMGKSEVIAPVNLLIKRALKETDNMKKLSADNEDELTNINYLIKDLKIFRQAVYGYGLEVREGYKGGASAKEMENIAMAAANNIVRLSRETVEDITFRIEDHNKTILKATKSSKKILGVVLIVFIFSTIMVAFFMGRALSKPINELVKATRHVAKGDLTQEIEVKSRDEIGELSRSFNNMVRELRESKAELVASKDYVDSIIASMVESLIVINPDSKIRTVNTATCNLLGYKEEEFIGKEISFLFQEKERGTLDRTFIERRIKEGAYRDYEINFKARDGREIPVLFSSSVMKDRDGNTTNIVCVVKDISERNKAEERIKHLAFYDDLTGLPNRVLFKERLDHAIKEARRYKRKISVLTLDLDDFKKINDTLGHSMGDLLLEEVAKRLTTCLRESDSVARRNENVMNSILARQGGDEFSILLSEIIHIEDTSKVAQRILDVISRPMMLENHELAMTASMGISTYVSDNENSDSESMLKNADVAMHDAKKKGKNNYKFFDKSMHDAAMRKLDLENKLRKAHDNGEFLLFYQPQIDIHTGQITGMEALLRWQHPEMGIIPPLEFIPLAEDTGLIIPMSIWILNTACEQNKAWQEAGFSQIKISVNLSAKQFKNFEIIETVKQVLEKTGLSPRYLELEITESIIMQNKEQTIAILKELNAMGLSLAMDDFGTGYSSLSYLKRFPFNIIKIDRSFITDVINSNEDAAIVRAIIAMAHSLELKVIAEGVETEQQLAFLREHGCDQMQGYLFSRPLPEKEASIFLEKSGQGTGISNSILNNTLKTTAKTS